MLMFKIKSKQPNIRVKKFNPLIDLEFTDKPILVNKSTADFLLSIGNNFELVGETEQNKKDYSKMTKDELLDYTALNKIKADYSMTKAEIIKIIKGDTQ